MATTIFVLIVSLLLIHEMDAIRAKEWKMFMILKDMADEKAYKIFTAIHLPLYFLAIFIMIQGEPLEKLILYLIIDFFLIGHSIIHFWFRNKPKNGFTSIFSNTIIYSMGIMAIVHLFLLIPTV